LVPKMQSLKLSEGASQSSVAGELVPIKRPDSGGLEKIRTVNILVNHFPVSFNAESVIRHYDIEVKPEVASPSGRPVKVTKTNLSLVMEKLFSDNSDFPLEMTAFDGEKNIFSAVELPTGTFTVELSPEEDVRCHTYKFSVTLVNELKLHKLKDYLTGNLLQLPREVLQGMDVVMKENPRRHMVSIGKSFHSIDPKQSPLYYGLVASEGFQHSLKPTSQGLALCLDYSVLAVRKRIPVIHFLREHIELTVFNSDSFRRRWKDIEHALIGLKVTVTHRRTKQKYVVSGLTDRNACDISFTVEDPNSQLPPRSVRLLDYFREKYPGIEIKYEDIPCLSLGKGRMANYVPLELCVLVEGQRLHKEELDRDSALLLKNMSLAHPGDRKTKICGMLQQDHGPSGGEISKNFGIDVTMNMTRVRGRVMEPPKLKLRSSPDKVNAINVDKDSCQWNLVNKLVVEGTTLKHWAVLDLSSFERRPADRLNKDFIPKLVARCNKLGLQMDYPLFTEQARMSVLASAESLTPVLEKVQRQAWKACQNNLQLLLCVMSSKDAGYMYIKWVSETKIGLVTQCCLSKMANKGQDQYLANLGMKINAKLGGSNAELYNQLPLFNEDAGHVMLIGADVNHPRPRDYLSPSIAAVVASMNWPAANKYIPRISPQGHCVEQIENFGHICLELIECYEKMNGVKPHKLVIFRDGVSEGQFDMVLNTELLGLKKVFQAIDYRPTITLIVAQKRHQTRLFPETQRDGGRNGNIPPGTVVDTTIVHPSEYDFYLCSHYGSIGTSKPTHYHVLWDEHNFSSDSVQKFIYDLCFTFARCCKPVSLAPPVYYADLLAYRGRLHYDAQSEKHSSSGNSSSSLALSSTSTSTSDMNALHSGIQDLMYFI
ncbi:hypothetical protein SOVF_200490, partial [Spinacia oleracea]